MEKKIYTLMEASEILGIGRNSTLNLFKEDSFPSFKIGGKWVVSVKALNEWLDNKSIK